MASETRDEEIHGQGEQEAMLIDASSSGEAARLGDVTTAHAQRRKNRQVLLAADVIAQVYCLAALLSL